MVARARPAGTGPKARQTPLVRVSIGLPPDVHETLGRLARERKVSLGWIVRDATEKYLADRWPLFRSDDQP
ncbi:MAG: hypothetical protein AMXMBFR36_38370 [Acidobacteriota bacterium]